MSCGLASASSATAWRSGVSMSLRRTSLLRVMSETMDAVHAVAAEEDDDVVAVITLTLLALGFGLGTGSDVLNHARGRIAPFK